MKKRRSSLLFSVVALGFIAPAVAGPQDLALTPSPQEFGNTCQSYSMALSMTFTPGSPYKADTPAELRELERRIRAALTKAAAGAAPTREHWRVAVETITDGKLTVLWKAFSDLDPAMRFAAEQVGISDPAGVGPVLSTALVHTPVMLSFNRIANSTYPPGHIVTIFGVQLPLASMGNTARPKLLLVNSAVKYAGGVKNICAEEALSEADKYRAVLTLTDDYVLKPMGTPPYLVTWVSKK